jgi:hypothetical protein
MQGKYAHRVEKFRDLGEEDEMVYQAQREGSLAGSTKPCYTWEQCHFSQDSAAASSYSSLMLLPRDLLLELMRTYVFFLKARRENRTIKASYSGLCNSLLELSSSLSSFLPKRTSESRCY